MRGIVAQIAEIIEEGISSSDIEQICREMVVDEVLDRARLITEEEIEALIAPTVSDSEEADLSEVSDGDEVIMTEDEYENLDDNQKVTLHDDDGETVAAVIVSGIAHPVNLKKSNLAKTIAKKLYSEMSQSMYAARVMGQVDDSEMQELFMDEPSDEWSVCPDCQSDDCTLVWVDGGCATLHCNSCGIDYEVGLDAIPFVEDEFSMAERTVEDVEIVPDYLFGSVWYEDGVWGFKVLNTEGETVYEGFEADVDDVYDIFKNVGEEFSFIEAGCSVMSRSGSFEVADVEGDTVYMSDGKIASRSKLAALSVDERVIVAQQARYIDYVKVGDHYVNEAGSSMTVLSVDDDDVVFEDMDAAERSANFIVTQMVLSKRAFLDTVADGGYKFDNSSV